MTTEERILEVIKNTFELPSVDKSCSQKTCEKWDSMGHLNLIVELEMEFNVSFDPEEIGTMLSLEEIVKILSKKQAKS